MARAKSNVEALQRKLGLPAYKLPMQQEMLKKQLEEAQGKLDKLVQSHVRGTALGRTHALSAFFDAKEGQPMPHDSALS